MDAIREELIERVRTDRIRVVNLQFTDISGAMKNVAVPSSRLRECLDEGVWFDGSSMEGIARVAERDIYLHPDPSTFALLPWESGQTARLICDLQSPDGKPFLADPRNALKGALAKAAELGYEHRVASEMEFFVFKDREGASAGGSVLEPIDRSGYFEVPAETAEKLSITTAHTLDGLGFRIEATHHEVTAGQQEIDIAELGALEAADALVMLKCALRGYSRRDGLLVSFMPKPIEGVAGSGLHMAQRLIDLETGANAFHDPAGYYQLSDVGRQFIAGQLAHARGMCAVVAPSVNSYKRLLGGAEAPARVCWGRASRNAAIRVPEVRSGNGTMVELRVPDPTCNPYLALAAMLKAGLDGVKNRTPLQEPADQLISAREGGDHSDEMANPLPETLREALEELDWDPVVREVLGQPIYERFLAAKAKEWLSYQHHISWWEVEHYLRNG